MVHLVGQVGRMQSVQAGTRKPRNGCHGHGPQDDCPQWWTQNDHHLRHIVVRLVKPFQDASGQSNLKTWCHCSCHTPNTGVLIFRKYLLKHPLLFGVHVNVPRYILRHGSSWELCVRFLSPSVWFWVIWQLFFGVSDAAPSTKGNNTLAFHCSCCCSVSWLSSRFCAESVKINWYC